MKQPNFWAVCHLCRLSYVSNHRRRLKPQVSLTRYNSSQSDGASTEAPPSGCCGMSCEIKSPRARRANIVTLVVTTSSHYNESARTVTSDWNINASSQDGSECSQSVQQPRPKYLNMRYSNASSHTVCACRERNCPVLNVICLNILHLHFWERIVQ